MQTKEETRFWARLGGTTEISLPLQQLQRRMNASAVESMIDCGVLTRLGDESLNGRSDQFDFGFGIRTYELSVENGCVRAWSDGPESPVEVERKSAEILNFSREAFLRFLAKRNGFDIFEGSRELVPGLFQIGKLFLGRTVTWLICFKPESLASRGAYMAVKEKLGVGDVVLLSLADRQYPLSNEWVRERNIVITGIPYHDENWIANRREFCNSRLGFRSRDIAKQLYEYAGIKLLVDCSDGMIFLFGVDLQLKKDTRPFDYIAKLSCYPSSPINATPFAIDILGHSPKQDFRQRMYDDKRNFMKAVRERITDSTTRDAAEKLFEVPKNDSVLLPLGAHEILQWVRQ